MRAGVHCSVLGGFAGALQEAAALKCETLQIFTRSPRNWKTRVYTDEEFTAFRVERDKLKIGPIVVHAPYLPNLCTSNEFMYRKSVDALKEDLECCEKLGAEFLVIHPGAYSETADVETGLARVVAALDEAFAEVPGQCKVLIENMAGGGRRIGGPFSEVGAIIKRTKERERLGVCFDTCHAFAAGYDISNKEGVRKTLQEFEREVGLDKIDVFHVNDSAGERGCNRDLHDHLGKGHVGLEGLQSLFTSHDLNSCAFILETPKGFYSQPDLDNLKKLRSLFR